LNEGYEGATPGHLEKRVVSFTKIIGPKERISAKREELVSAQGHAIWGEGDLEKGEDRQEKS